MPRRTKEQVEREISHVQRMIRRLEGRVKKATKRFIQPLQKQAQELHMRLRTLERQLERLLPAPPPQRAWGPGHNVVIRSRARTD